MHVLACLVDRRHERSKGEGKQSVSLPGGFDFPHQSACERPLQQPHTRTFDVILIAWRVANSSTVERETRCEREDWPLMRSPAAPSASHTQSPAVTGDRIKRESIQGTRHASRSPGDCPSLGCKEMPRLGSLRQQEVLRSKVERRRIHHPVSLLETASRERI